MSKLVPVLLLTLFLLSACGQSGNKDGTADQSRNANPVTTRYKPEKNGKIVARVNGVPIYEDELKGRPIRSAVTDEIFYQEGLKEGVDKKYEDKVMAYQMSLVVRDVRDSIMDKMPPEKEVSDQDLLDYYNKHKESIYTNVSIEEINFPNKDLGEKIMEMAQKGEQFQEIAKSLPDSDSKVTVTDLGFNKSLSRYFKVKEVGSLSDIVDKKDGTYSILKVTEVKTIPFANVKGVLQYTVESRKKGQTFDDYAEKMAKEDGMKIEIIKNSGQP